MHSTGPTMRDVFSPCICHSPVCPVCSGQAIPTAVGDNMWWVQWPTGRPAAWALLDWLTRLGQGRGKGREAGVGGACLLHWLIILIEREGGRVSSGEGTLRCLTTVSPFLPPFLPYIPSLPPSSPPACHAAVPALPPRPARTTDGPSPAVHLSLLPPPHSEASYREHDQRP